VLRDKLSIPRTARNMVLRRLEELLSDINITRNRGATSLPKEDIDFNQKTIDLGASIFKYLMPMSVRTRLEETNSKTVLLTTDDVEVPWELLHDGKTFLCLKCEVGRKVQTKTPFRETKKIRHDRLRALFIADPTGDLPDAEKEVNVIIQTMVDTKLMEIDYLKQEEATAANIFEKLESCSYDILHYAGHAEFNSNAPEESSLILRDERITAGYIFHVVTRPPTLAFINACSSARTSGLEYMETEGKLSGMATALLSSGVDAYIGTLWPVHDEIASKLSITFYKRVLQGETVGSALTNAKHEIVNDENRHSNTWASFILYGEPSAALTDSWLALARHEKDKSKMLEYFTKHLESNPTDAEAWHEKGLVLRELGKNKDTMTCYDKALEVNPEFRKTWREKAFLLIRLGNYEEAIFCCDKTIEIDSKDAEVWDLRGLALRRLNRYDEALASYEKALEVEPIFYQTWDNIGFLLNSLGRYEEAISYFDKALEIMPTYTTAWGDKGDALACLGRHEEAINCYEKVLEIITDTYEAWTRGVDLEAYDAYLRKGESLFILKRHEKAIESFNEALTIRPNNAEAFLKMGKILAYLGKQEEALEHYNRALEINPNYEEAKYIKSQIEEHLK